MKKLMIGIFAACALGIGLFANELSYEELMMLDEGAKWEDAFGAVTGVEKGSDDQGEKITVTNAGTNSTSYLSQNPNLSPAQRALLDLRVKGPLQKFIDAWHLEHPGQSLVNQNAPFIVRRTIGIGSSRGYVLGPDEHAIITLEDWLDANECTIETTGGSISRNPGGGVNGGAGEQ